MTTRTLSINPVAAVGDPLTRHLELVAAVRPFAPPSAEWDGLVARLRDFRAQGATPQRDKLIEAILHGGSDAGRISELRALATVETAPVNATLMTIVQGAVRAELFALYEPGAVDGYAAVARVFDATAAKFAACAAKVDVEADSEAVVGLPAAARAAWIDAVGHAGTLDELLVTLLAAAELAGTVIDTDEQLIGLAISNAADLHRRQLWAAFLSANPLPQHKAWVSRRELARAWAPPRCGRWAALCKLGATVAAADITEPIHPIDKPPQLDRRERRVPGQLSNAVFVFDPADSDYAEQLAAHGFPPREGSAYGTAAH